MRDNEALVIEPAKSWQRLQPHNPEFFFEDLDQLMKENYQQFLEMLMGYERQCFLNAHPYERSQERVDQANGFYRRTLTTRLGRMELRVPRTRSGEFRPQVLPRYQRRQAAINEALKEVFLLGVSTRQTGRALATLVEEAVSASTVSAVAKALDASVLKMHRRRLADHYRYLIFDGVSVRLRLNGAVQKRMVLCAYGVSLKGQRELIDFQIVRAEGEDQWRGFLWGLWSRGLRGEHLQMIVTDGNAGLAKALGQNLGGRAAPTLLGAQTAQPGEQTQSFPAGLPGRSQTHLPVGPSHRSHCSLSCLEKEMAGPSAQSGDLPGKGPGRTTGFLRLPPCSLETLPDHQCD